MKRFLQVIRYGWRHANQIATNEKKHRLTIFLDILSCFYKYKMWSNQYLAERFWEKSKEERKKIGATYFEKGKVRDEWQRDFQENNEFLIEYTQMKYERARLREKRNKAYAKRYNAGDGLFVEYGVIVKRQHYGNGKIKIGKKVLLARDVDLDYTGGLTIDSDVAVTEGTKILTHGHDFLAMHGENDLIPNTNRVFLTPLHIANHVMIGAHTIVMPGVSSIGEHAVILPGSVVMKRVPPCVVVGGNPAKILGEIPESAKELFINMH